MNASFWQRVVPRLLHPKVAIPLMLLAAIVLGPLAYRGYRLSLVPDIGEPFDIEAFSKVEIADEDNAFVEYRAAVAALKPGHSVPSESEIDAAVEGGWATASEGVRQWLEDNRPALEIWRRGTSKPNALYYRPSEMQIGTELPVTEQFPTIARLVRIEASRLEAAGVFEEAWGWHRALFRCSRHTSRHSCVTQRLQASECHWRASEGINRWAALSGVDVAVLRNALQSVQTDYALTAPLSETVKTEYVMSVHPKSFVLARNWIEPPGILKRIVPLTLFVLAEPEVSCGVLRLIFHNYLSHIDTPRQQRPVRRTVLELFDVAKKADSQTVVLSPTEIEECRNNTLFAHLFIPDYISYCDLCVGYEEGRQAAIVIALALQWYYREHQTFPETLQQLVGRYLDEIPLDPFGEPGDRLRYRRDGEKATVWSIGYDGIDNGGDVVHKAGHETKDIGYTVVAPVRREP